MQTSDQAVTTSLDYEALILRGIEQGKGNPEDLALIKPEWLIELGARAADLGAKRRMKFHSFMVKPINTVEEGLTQGHYTGHYDHITNKTVALERAEGLKWVYVVPFNRTIGKMEYVTLLAEHDLKPCVNAPNYLLGIMAAVPEDKMPGELRNKHIVAAEPDKASSVFTDEFGRRCFLYVYRFDPARGLSLARVDGGWHDECACLAEEILVP